MICELSKNIAHEISQLETGELFALLNDFTTVCMKLSIPSALKDESHYVIVGGIGAENKTGFVRSTPASTGVVRLIPCANLALEIGE